MKKLFFIFLLIPFICNSQIIDSTYIKQQQQIKQLQLNVSNAGFELQKHSNNIMWALMSAPFSMLFFYIAKNTNNEIQYTTVQGVPFYKKDNSGRIFFYSLSGVCGVITISFSISSILNINKAGKYLRNKY